MQDHTTPRALAAQAQFLPNSELAAPIEADTMWRLWRTLRKAWLNMAYNRSGSENTRMAYETASRMWLECLGENGIAPWEATAMHVRSWQETMRVKSLSPATINQRLAAVSSWYTFVINEVHLVDGVERSAFADATGHARANPFRVGNLRRERVERYGKAYPMPVEDLQRLFGYLVSRNETLLGSRNWALILTCFLTAARNAEVAKMRWGDIRPSRSQPETYVWAWRGKGGKQDDVPLPKRAYEAIKHHLEIAGRWEPEPDEYIWQPLVTHGAGNLMSARHGKPSRGHISQKNAVRILHTALRLAGVKNAEQYRVHDLRHTFAHLYQGDLESLRRILHHESLNTTGIYVRSLQDPVDRHSEQIWQSVMGD